MTNRFYKTAFFVLLLLFLLFWAWLLASMFSGLSPVEFIGSAFKRADSNSEMLDEGIILPRDFASQDLAAGIIPDEGSIEALSENGNCITIVFSDEMDVSFSELLYRSIYLLGEEPLDYSDTHWSDDRTFSIQLSRSLNEDEAVSLTYRFKDSNGKYLPLVEVSYD